MSYAEIHLSKSKRGIPFDLEMSEVYMKFKGTIYVQVVLNLWMIGLWKITLTGQFFSQN